MEGLVEYYSENLSEDVLRGMREAALRGSFLGPQASLWLQENQGAG